jgi:hypothetical protein
MIAMGFALVFAVVFAADARSDSMAKLAWEFDGPVVRRFRSENHGALAIEAGPPRGGEFEFVDQDLWDAVAIGTRVAKVQCSAVVAVHKAGGMEHIRVE